MDALELELQTGASHLIWMVGTELGAPARAADVLFVVVVTIVYMYFNYLGISRNVPNHTHSQSSQVHPLLPL